MLAILRRCGALPPWLEEAEITPPSSFDLVIPGGACIDNGLVLVVSRLMTFSANDTPESAGPRSRNGGFGTLRAVSVTELLDGRCLYLVQSLLRCELSLEYSFQVRHQYQRELWTDRWPTLHKDVG